MFARRPLAALLAAIALIATSCGGSAESASAAVEPAPAEAALVASTIEGGQIDFASLEGQDVVLWFWAPW